MKNKPNFKWHALPNLIRLLLSIYVVCFLIGGLRHWLDLARDGLFPYKTVPFIFNFYLTSLAIVDFAVIILIFISPIYALTLAIIIMASDLSVDLYVGYHYWNSSLAINLGLQLLLAFGLFVFISAPPLIKWLKNNT